MKISYKKAIVIFLVLYILPAAVMGVFVNRRIQQRQLAIQLFLQNQVDIDRKTLTVSGTLRDVQPKLRRAILGSANAAEQKNIMAQIKDDRETFSKFWEQYRANYSAKNRPFLLNILAESQELNLVEEEAQTLDAIKLTADDYFASIFNHPLFQNGSNLGAEANLRFLDDMTDKRLNIYDQMNKLADIRYIFAQRVVFFVSGENAAQQGVFNTIFVGIILVSLMVALIQYFVLLRPVGDIMLFLSDLAQGKRGQRLYFSSPIKEIKQSEEIINNFVEAAEKHEEHNHIKT
jgi:hypothetical protein